jgi:hypothetical protein
MLYVKFHEGSLLKLIIAIINTAYQFRIPCKLFTLKNAASLEKVYIIEKEH